AATLLWRWRRGGWDALLLIGLAITGAAIAGAAIALAVQRPPLPGPRWAEPPRFSFPSGVALLGAAFYGSLARLAARAWPGWRTRVRAWTIALVLALLSGAGALVLGRSQLTDVLAGLALGWLWLAITVDALSLWR